MRLSPLQFYKQPWRGKPWPRPLLRLRTPCRKMRWEVNLKEGFAVSCWLPFWVCASGSAMATTIDRHFLALDLLVQAPGKPRPLPHPSALSLKPEPGLRGHAFREVFVSNWVSQGWHIPLHLSLVSKHYRGTVIRTDILCLLVCFFQYVVSFLLENSAY